MTDKDFEKVKNDTLSYVQNVVDPMLKSFESLDLSRELPQMGARSHKYRIGILDEYYGARKQDYLNKLRLKNPTWDELRILLDLSITLVEMIRALSRHMQADLEEIESSASYRNTHGYHVLNELGQKATEVMETIGGLKCTIAIVEDLSKKHNHQVVLN